MRLVVIQQSEELRARYLAEVVLYDPSMLIFTDEIGSNRKLKDAKKNFGYSLRSQHCIGKSVPLRTVSSLIARAVLLTTT